MRTCGTSRRGVRRARAFTLVEVLIVMLILGMLAVLVVPQMSNAAGAEREGSLRENLRALRTQIMVYRAQHGGVSPGYPDGDARQQPTLAVFIEQMTLYSDARGRTSPVPSPQFCYGPYLQQVPINPITGDAGVRFLTPDEPLPQQAGGPEGWLYRPSTATLIANAPGVDAHGTPYIDY